VYIHGDFAYRSTVSASATPTEVTRAQVVFPGLHGTVGLESDPSTPSPSVEYLTSTGSLPPPGSPAFAVPSGTMVVAQVPEGLLVESGGDGPAISSFTPIELEVDAAGRSRSLGDVSAVIAVHDATVAVAVCTTGSDTSCSLRLINTTTGATRTIAAPRGFDGYAPAGGTFSPGGDELAVFVASVDTFGGAHLHLTLIDTHTSAVTAMLQAATIYDSGVADSTWSRDGRWLFFGSSEDPLYAQRVLGGRPLGQPIALPFTATSAVAGL
jgi:hypothetical protein